MSGQGVPWPVRRGLYRNTIWWENGRSKSKRHRDLLVSRKVVDIYVLKKCFSFGKIESRMGRGRLLLPSFKFRLPFPTVHSEEYLLRSLYPRI